MYGFSLVWVRIRSLFMPLFEKSVVRVSEMNRLFRIQINIFVVLSCKLQQCKYMLTILFCQQFKSVTYTF